MQVVMSKNFHSVFEPRDVGSGRPFRDAQESDLMAQYVLKVEMRRKEDLSTLRTIRGVMNKMFTIFMYTRHFKLTSLLL